MKALIKGIEVECTPAEFNELVGVSMKKVDGRVNNGKHLRKKAKGGRSDYRKWTPAEDFYITKYRHIFPRKKLARELNKKFGVKRSVQAVSTRLWQLDVEKKAKGK